MPRFKRLTIAIEPAMLEALRLRASETSQSVSEVVNVAVRHALLEDYADSAVFRERRSEPALSFDAVVKMLKRRGKL